jgi:hypothetical protein
MEREESTEVEHSHAPPFCIRQSAEKSVLSNNVAWDISVSKCPGTNDLLMHSYPGSFWYSKKIPDIYI